MLAALRCKCNRLLLVSVQGQRTAIFDCRASLFKRASFELRHYEQDRGARAKAFSSCTQVNLRKVIEERIGPLSTGQTVLDSRPLVVVISGPSGVGKDAVIKSLRQARPDLTFVVTATSRSRRPGEVEGEDYFFVSKEQFEKWLKEGNLLEHAVVYGEYKGIPRTQVERALEAGSDVVLRVDVQGAETVRKMIPDSVCIFLAADSEAELVERLISRKTEPLESMLVRIQTAREECKFIDDFDYVVTNREGRLEETVEAISAVIDAEKLRVKRRRPDSSLQRPAKETSTAQ